MASTSEATRRHGASPESARKSLKLANEVRLTGAAVKQLVAAGELTVTDALYDERAQAVKIGHLLCAQHGWGVTKAQQLLGRLQIWPTRQVRQLTERQKTALIEALGKST